MYSLYHNTAHFRLYSNIKNKTNASPLLHLHIVEVCSHYPHVVQGALSTVKF